MESGPIFFKCYSIFLLSIFNIAMANPHFVNFRNTCTHVLLKTRFFPAEINVNYFELVGNDFEIFE